jgi:hypothetical protein
VDDPHFWAGVFRPFFWLLVMLPFLAGLRWVLNRYIRPRLSPGTWGASQKPVNDVWAAVLILCGIMAAGLLATL